MNAECSNGKDISGFVIPSSLDIRHSSFISASVQRAC